MLKIADVDYHYQQECFQFDLSMEQGSIIALMGPSGAGKSTLLSLVAGFIDPVSGDIQVNERSVIGKEPHQRPFSMLFQEHNLFAHLTVRENIGLGLHPGLKLTSKQIQQVQDSATQVGVDALLDRLPEHLSGGQRQRVALARCFVQPHSIWLLDEPFSALDPVLREEMLALVKRLADERNITVLMVTHHINDAKAIASHFAFIANYRVDATGEIGQLSQQHENTQLADFVQAAL
ncbi:thiamine ABC transporter ATP-binding protein [Vibrio sp. 10N.261.55.A7]|uniref:thiamine ABC transporter ATP-binding protein n=1 Tax=Vibrio sp. 10N.261.55.A7 TaxID=1880851 RepID=UPI000C855D9B|nr:thiamine ABC transporter ATP-binding protein [Vibrio sp. 10N.261.55.A7]PMK01446.1 thiamine ABC transporter, ATP-binding protein [Vibrio sp. 10N.261.55.A7]